MVHHGLLLEEIRYKLRVALRSRYSLAEILYRLGILPDGLRFSFNSEEDTKELWNRTAQAMQYYEIDPAWIKDKFGIEVTGKRSNGQEGFFGSAPEE